MTPREHETLEIILRHVGAFNKRVVSGARIERVVVLRDKGAPQAADFVIAAVEFRPNGARCA